MAYTDIDKPSDYFETVLYTGTGSTQSITSLDFQPDWVWGKTRNDTQDHQIIDSVRGATKLLATNGTAAEFTDTNNLTSFNSNGFTVGSSGGINGSSDTLVTWCWKAGGSASSNSNGSITSSVSANQDAGFSIVSWTGNGSTATIGHGLGSAPKVVIIKSRDNSSHAWFLGHESLGWTKYMTLENTNGENTDVIWNNTAPTSSVFSVGGYSSTNGSGVKFIGYCFAEKKGYSKFSSYVGNGSSDGSYIHLGFKPAFVMVKVTNTTNNWMVFDNKRSDVSGANVNGNMLRPNLSDAELTDDDLDFLSNGFKWRRNSAGFNGSGNTFIFMAFAENPFVTSTGVPATAR